MDEKSFRNAMGYFATGVTLVCAKTATGRPVGVTVSSFCSLSLDPPLILICLDDKTADLEAYISGDGFNVHLLAAGQQELSNRFAGRSDDKFAGLEVGQSANGRPVIAAVAARIDCSLEAVHQGGDHKIIIGRVTHLEHDPDSMPLIYWRGGYRRLAEPEEPQR